MTRRDTIIVAALVNAGLLVILFVSALKNEEGREEISFRKEAPNFMNSEATFRSEAKRVMGDEVDQVLNQYGQQDPLHPVAVSTPVDSSPQVPNAMVSNVPSFVDDLKSITEVSPLVAASSLKTEEKAAPSPLYTEVKVKKGDVLEKIARQNHTTVSEIMKINHLTSTQLKIGQVLKISSKGESKSVVKTEEKTPLDPTSAKYYIVKAGDSPWTIAVKNHMKVEELLKLNNMNEEKARKLKPGDKIRTR